MGSTGHHHCNNEIRQVLRREAGNDGANRWVGFQQAQEPGLNVLFCQLPGTNLLGQQVLEIRNRV